MSQDALRITWKREEVDARLKKHHEGHPQAVPGHSAGVRHAGQLRQRREHRGVREGRKSRVGRGSERSSAPQGRPRGVQSGGRSLPSRKVGSAAPEAVSTLEDGEGPRQAVEATPRLLAIVRPHGNPKGASPQRRRGLGQDRAHVPLDRRVWRRSVAAPPRPTRQENRPGPKATPPPG